MSTKVTSKGQVTIPKRVRDFLGLGRGSAVEFDLNRDGQVVISKIGKKGPRSLAERLESLRGCATAGLTTDEIMAMTRGEP